MTVSYDASYVTVSVVEARFPSDLETVSSGVGEERVLSVYKKGNAPKLSASEVHRAQGPYGMTVLQG